jgi:predicted DNA-binding transcriptional regulator AlpA
MGDTEVSHDIVADGAFAIPEAVRFTGYSRASLYRAMDAGQLEYIKLGRRRLIPRRAAIRLLAQGLRGGTRAD